MTPLTTFDKRQLRNVLGTFTTGVTIVTTCDGEGVCHGVTANSFSSVSLDPPLVLWSQALTSRSFPAFRDSEHFAVNILADDQVSISNHFAKSQEDKFSGIEHSPGLGGAPVLHGTVAHLECVKVATYPGGDHVVYLGRVERVGHSNRRPLAFGSGRYVVPIAHDLGPVSLQMGNAMPAHEEAVRMATDALPQICEAVGQYTLCLVVWGNHGPTIIRWEPSSNPVSGHLRTGLVMNVTSTAGGRVFAAYLPAEATRSFIAEDLRLFRGADEDEAEQRQRFEDEMTQTRLHGIARTTDPQPAHLLHRIDTNAFSAPIFDAGGNVVMALSVISSADRLDPAWDGPVPLAIKAAAADLSCRLGWTGVIAA